jgi:hypothetical protein
MHAFKSLLALGVLLTSSSIAFAQQQGMLDLIPHDAAAGVVIRNLTDLRKKGDKFIAETDLQTPIRPSELFSMAYNFLGIRGGVDEDGSAAIVLLSPEKRGKDIDFGDLEKLLVGIVPIGDHDKLAANFGFKPGGLVPNKIMPTTAQNFGKVVYVRGKHLILANHTTALERYTQAKPVGADLSAVQRKSFNQSDIVLHLGPRAWADQWKQFLREVEKNLEKPEDVQEQKIVRQLIDSLADPPYGIAAFRLDGGLSVNFVAVFGKENKIARVFLAGLGSTTAGSSLRGLPEGRVIAAQATVGDGGKNAPLARTLFQFVLKAALESKEVFSATDRPSFVGVFNEVWQRLKGSRAAVYLTSDESRLGLFSLVAILDTDDAQQFLKEMKTLARIADAAGVDLTQKANDLGIDMEKLARDLGDNVYRVRESATTKLRLIGEPAVPYLEKAIETGRDLETVRRAQKLKAQISVTAAERRKELLSKDLPRYVRPTFAFAPRAETRAGYAIDVVKIKLADKDLPATKQMQQLLGPQWDNLRLAVHEKQVVVLLGSEVGLLDAALKNLKEGKPGLAAAPSLAPFKQHGNPERRVEFHLSVEKLLALINPERPGTLRPLGSTWTSFSLTAQPDRLQFDLWLPASEVKTMVRQKQLPR